MHDSVFFEDQGIPTATIVSSEFVRAARLQAAAIGAADYEVVSVPHPIQPLTRDEVRAIADVVIDDILKRLTSRTDTREF